MPITTNTAQQFLESALYQMDLEGIQLALSLGAKVDASAYPLRSPNPNRPWGMGLMGMLRTGLLQQRAVAHQHATMQRSVHTVRADLDKQALACVRALVAAGLDPLSPVERGELAVAAGLAPMFFRGLVRAAAALHTKPGPDGGVLHALMEHTTPQARDVVFVIKNGGDVHELNGKGQTPAMMLLRRRPSQPDEIMNTMAVVLTMHAHGADLMVRDDEGTVVDRARVLLSEQISRARGWVSADMKDKAEQIIAQLDAIELAAHVPSPSRAAVAHKM